ncbi:MAG: hypothetical protein ACI88A_001848 [Paraglaciecola sp.]|jgi:hypothetical protein
MKHFSPNPRRDFLKLSGQMLAAGVVSGFVFSCGKKEQIDPVDRPHLIGFKMSAEAVDFHFGESAKEAGILLGEELPKNYDPKIKTETLVFDGGFEVSPTNVLLGNAVAALPDGSKGAISIKNAITKVDYLETSIEFSKEFGPLMIRVNGEVVEMEPVYNSMRAESSSIGLSMLSEQSKALVIYAAFVHSSQVRANIQSARILAFLDDDDDYEFWCNLTTTAGAIAMAGLSAAACYALLAGCVAGLVVLDGLGAIPCVIAAGICGAVAAGLQALIQALKSFLWSDLAVEA